MNLLAIDPGRSCAWARSDRTTGVLDLSPGKYPDDGQAIHVFWQWLADELAMRTPDALIIERAFFVGRVRDADFTIALIRVAHTIAWVHQVPRREMAAVTVRARVFPGQKKPSDKERILAMRGLGWRPETDHEADAAALLVADEIIQAQKVAA